MWNPFKRHKEKKALEMLDSLTSIIATIKKWEKAGLIYWQVKGKTLLIEQSLATTLLAGGSKLFQKFLDIAAQIQNSELLADAYEQQRITIETQAVRMTGENVMHGRAEALMISFRNGGIVCKVVLQKVPKRHLTVLREQQSRLDIIMLGQNIFS